MSSCIHVFYPSLSPLNNKTPGKIYKIRKKKRYIVNYTYLYQAYEVCNATFVLD